jgi:sugar phosphate isomerase/epimerase
MTRRDLLAATLLAPAALYGKTRIDKTHISAITDEIGLTPQDALDFAKQYGLRWIELRNVPGSKPGKEYAFLSEAEVKEAATSFASNGLKVSFVNTGLLKFTWPGTEPLRKKPEADTARTKRLADEQKHWDARKDDVHRACVSANILGCDKLRVFAGTRVPDPKTVYQRIVDEIMPLAEIAGTYKVHLLVENEASQNIGTSQELADIMPMLPSKWIGFNWDPQNALPLKEVPWPNGYAVLPKKRMLNLQFKGKGIMEKSPEKIDWAAIVKALDKDGYQGQLGLETHLFDGTLIAAAHESMETMLRIVG